MTGLTTLMWFGCGLGVVAIAWIAWMFIKADREWRKSQEEMNRLLYEYYRKR